MEIKVEGLREIEAKMDELSVSTGRAALRRVLRKAGEPLADLMARMAPDDPVTPTDDLRASFGVSTKLTRGQSRTMRRERRLTGDSSAAEVYVGPASDKFYGQFQEFGTSRHAPQPFMRPAWDQDKEATLDRIIKELSGEISRTVARSRARAARRG